MAITLTVKVKGLKELETAMQRAPVAIQNALRDSATLVGDHILNTRGLRQYPPEGPGNRPPVPYWKRGVGREVSAGRKKQGAGGRVRATRNLHNSEKLGSRFYSLGEIASPTSLVVRIGNVASYAPYVVGERQSRVMAKIGWKKLSDVARAKLNSVGRIFEAVLKDTFKRIGL